MIRFALPTGGSTMRHAQTCTLGNGTARGLPPMVAAWPFCLTRGVFLPMIKNLAES
jgi:hypothetical protein